MGNGSTSMAGFSNLTEADYDALQFPSTPPPYRAAMELASKFGTLELGPSAGTSASLACVSCGRLIGRRQRVLSLDEADDENKDEMKVDGEEEKEEVKDDEEAKEGTLNTGAFTYEGSTYCSLECFFFKYSHKPCLCAYVDKLAEVLFSVPR
mmetsp:Transcript_5249/g.10483  ORF Transcript_5249/g.10483 Transcript_5249/m.10483 type:complete len:152 (-) Transcript_5249:30-485(-)